MRNLLFFAVLIWATSCVPHKDVVYFNDLDPFEGGNLNLPDIPQLTLKSGDLVEINITSISQETNTFFIKPGSASDSRYAPNVYQITSEGMVDIPLVGQINLSGKTTSEAEAILRERLLEYVQKPTVNVRLVSFRITVLGEVRNPGVYEIPDSRVNILEALGFAGDLTIFASRDNVMLIRNIGEQKRYYRINLNNSTSLNQDLFYLQNNDVLYIEPSKGRTASDDNIYRLLPLVLSGLTFVVVIISLTQ